MVLGAETYHSPAGYGQQNYAQESSYKDSSYYGNNNSSSMQMMRPTPGFNNSNQGPTNYGMSGYGGYGSGTGTGGYAHSNGMSQQSSYYSGNGHGHGHGLGHGNGQGQGMYSQHGGYGSNGGYGSAQGHMSMGSAQHFPMGSTNRMEESRYEYQGSNNGPFGQQRNHNSWVSKDLDD